MSNSSVDRREAGVLSSRFVYFSVPATVTLAAFSVLVSLVVILVVNIQASAGQYRLVELTVKSKELKHQNEALSQELNRLESSRNVASLAYSLGMVPSEGFGVLDFRTGKVVKKAVPAPAWAGDVPAFVDPYATLPAPVVRESDEVVLEAPRQHPPGW